MFVDLFANFMNQIPGNKEYILSQYDLVGENSRFATEPNEMMIVVDENQTLTDITFAQLGFFTEEQFLNLAKKAIEENKEEPDEEKVASYDYPKEFTYDDVLNKEFMYYPHNKIWSYKDIKRENVKFVFNVAMDMTKPEDVSRIAFNLVYDSETDSLVGSVSADGTGYDEAAFVRTTEKDISNKFVGNWKATGLLASYFPISIDLNIDSSENHIATLNIDIDMGGGMTTHYPLGTATYTESWKDVSGYRYAADCSSLTGGTPMKIVGILKAKPDINFGCMSRGVYYTPALTRQMINDAMESDLITNPTTGLEAYIGSEAENDEPFRAYVTYEYTSWVNGNDDPHYDIKGESSALSGNALASMFVTTSASNTDIDRTYLRNLAGLASKLQMDGTYLFDDVPQDIYIYPKDFEAKDYITDYLDQWNKDVSITIGGNTLKAEDREELPYVDTIEIIITVINSLIKAITIALVAFSSLALLVSCFMIAVITYISTMERVKEIGVIRSLGGRKKDVSRLFIAECLVIGFLSGIFGLLITKVLCIILNAIVAPMGVIGIAALTWLIIGVMLGLSILLNVLSGLIPSMKASKQDPVIALRTE